MNKVNILKKEKRKKKWILEREKDQINQKIQRNNEAEKIYFKWLKSKIFSKDNQCHLLTEDKPPWTPPGIANSLI